MSEPLLDEEFMSRLERLTLLSRATITGRIRGERRSRRRGASTEFADHRDYVPGDDIRYLDWNIYGRLDRLFIKLFEEEEELTVCLLVDCSQSMAHGLPEKFRYARQVAAALGVIALGTDDRVGVFPFDRELRAALPPLRGRRNALRLISWLGALEAGSGTGLAASLSAFAAAAPPRGVVILISDLLDPAGYADALRSVAGRRADVHLIHILSPDELEPTLAGDLRLVDCEDGGTVDVTVGGAILESYRRTVAQFRAGVREACSRFGIQALFASTGTPVDQLILGYLRARRLVG
jgi:uncharacterized protein (DUF58 family)